MKKTHISSIMFAAVALAAFSFTSCAQFNDAAITTGVSVATSTTLKAAIHDPAKRTQIANYIEGPYANAVRSISGNPSPDNFVLQLNAFIPQNIKDEYPELVTFVNPLVLFGYQQAYDKYGTDIKLVSRYLNDVATGLQLGAAPYATH